MFLCSQIYSQLDMWASGSCPSGLECGTYSLGQTSEGNDIMAIRVCQNVNMCSTVKEF